MLSTKQVGLDETDRIRQRVIRDLAKRRVTPDDCKYITDRLDQIDARIVSMPEYPEEGTQ